MALIELLFRPPSPEEVVRTHGPAVMRQLRRMFGPHADVDDVFQAVFVEVLRSLPRFRAESKLKTWIHRITLNVAYQEMRMNYRSRGTFAPLDDVSEPSTDVDLEADLLDKQSLEILYAGLGQLNEKKRIAVILHDIEGMTLREISERLGRPLPTVASQVKAGRAELAMWMTARHRSSSDIRALGSTP